MSASIVSAIAAHKIMALIIATIAVTGGAFAVSSSASTIGTMSFSVNSPITVTSLASLNLGTLNPGETKTMTSSASVNVTSSGNFTLFLQNRELIDEVFSSFSVNITGLSSSPIVLSLEHPAQVVSLVAGTYKVTVTVMLTVSTEIEHSLTVSNVSFLGLGTFPLHPEEGPACIEHDQNGDNHGQGDNNGQGNGNGNGNGNCQGDD